MIACLTEPYTAEAEKGGPERLTVEDLFEHCGVVPNDGATSRSFALLRRLSDGKRFEVELRIVAGYSGAVSITEPYKGFQVHQPFYVVGAGSPGCLKVSEHGDKRDGFDLPLSILELIPRHPCALACAV